MMKSAKKILLATDKFKFTLDAFQVIEAVCEGIEDDLKYQIVKFPLADGGEGTSDILSVYMRSEAIFDEVHDPVFKRIRSKYYFSEETQTALIDLASASGLYLLNKKNHNPMNTSTYGTGEIIKNAINKGAKKIFIGSGGSATTDAGIGAANALGYIFLDKKGKELKPVGRNLSKVQKIINEEKILFKDIEINILCDVENVLYGQYGAAYVYSKQKGANKKTVKLLDKGLKHIASIFKNEFNKDISSVTGGGSAGGFAAGAAVLLNADLIPGAETILDIAGFANHLSDTDLIITGEGKFDLQSFQGKITGKVIEKASKKNIPVIVICGRNDINPASIPYKNILSIQPLFLNGINMNAAKELSYNLIKKTTENIFKNLNLF